MTASGSMLLAIDSFARNPKTGQLRILNTQNTQGKNPVHLALDPSERYLVVSNHIGASLAVLPIQPDGTLAAVHQLVSLEGTPEPHRTEQPHAKPHFNPFCPDGRFVLVPDKGLDCIFVFPFQKGKLIKEKGIKTSAREGSGPRHLVFHPNGKFAYCVNELDSTVTAYEWNGEQGKLSPMQIITTLPESFTGNNRAAAIVISDDGHKLYTSNRGHDSITLFHAHPKTGWLTFIECQSTQGMTPRFICLTPDNRYLFALNEETHTIQPFTVNQSCVGSPDAGRLSPVPNQISTGSPVCLIFSPKSSSENSQPVKQNTNSERQAW